jgi:exodeoxyribonuclease V alpha subunit
MPRGDRGCMRIYGSDGIPRRNQKNPLGLDLLVLDEASMIDLSLMAKILDALPDHAGLILLGDKDQLDAVQPGRVFGDICRGGGHSASLRAIVRDVTGVDDPDPSNGVGPLSDSLFVLTKSYRFAAGLGIGEMASAVNRGDSDRALEILGSDPSHEMSWKKLPDDHVAGSLQKPILNWLEPYFEKVKSGAPEGECFDEFKKFRLITPLRKGSLGVEGLNAAIEQMLRRAGLADGEGEWYPGRPILITANNYSLNLFNGDVGITMQDSDGSLRVVFPGQGSSFRLIAPARLPAFEAAYTVTVHKSQGSEFESVLLLVPEPEAEVQNRNLLYTAITRARKRCEIWGTEEAIRSAIGRTPTRSSGLAERLK